MEVVTVKKIEVLEEKVSRKRRELDELIQLWKEENCPIYKVMAEQAANAYYIAVEELKMAEKNATITQSTKSNQVINVFYQSGYRWTVDVEGEPESRLVNVSKAEATALAKHIQKTEGGKLNIQTLTKEERKQALIDRWEHVFETGYRTLDYRG